MVPFGLISLLMLTLAVQCNSQPMEEPPARWHPPPVVSFLRQLWGAQRRAPLEAPAPRELGLVQPFQYIQPDSAGQAISLPRSPWHRTRRQLSPQPSGRGCQLGTCQTHNLFNWLYHIGARDLKDDSQKDMADPWAMGAGDVGQLGGEPLLAPRASAQQRWHPPRAGPGTIRAYGVPPAETLD